MEYLGYIVTVLFGTIIIILFLLWVKSPSAVQFFFGTDEQNRYCSKVDIEVSVEEGKKKNQYELPPCKCKNRSGFSTEKHGDRICWDCYLNVE